MKKHAFILATVAATVLVTACHQNPLSGHDEKASAKFLLDASKYAEKKANRMISGTGYQQCMGENLTRFNCQQLFAHMVEFANSTKEFKGLTVADLKDKSVFSKIGPAYEHERFTSI